MQIVRWNGALGNYTVLPGKGPSDNYTMATFSRRRW